MLTAGCSTLEKVVYRPDINQGNYLTTADMQRVHDGMTKQQVAYVLGTPMMHDPFGSNVWYYVFRQQPGHEDVKQQTLTLTFNNSDVLVHMENKAQLDPQS